MRPGKPAKLTKDDSEQAHFLYQAVHELASRRAKVEHVFRDIKIRFGYAKNCYRGLAKNAARLTFLTAIANVLRADAYERRSLIASAIWKQVQIPGSFSKKTDVLIKSGRY